ncbi:general secretion pathway protein [Flavobacterium sp. HTF]|nr:general secretion pathway protein [Flavobacterium sp. HTF]
MWFLKLILIITLLIVLYQDCRDRLVYWFLYPVIGVLVFAVQSCYLPLELVFLNSGLNLLFILILLGTSFLYIKFRKLSFQNAIGIGDVLFFIFLSFGFATISFIVLFVFSLLFSLLLHFVFQNRNQLKTVPLAGYMSLFFGVVYVVTFCSDSTILYAY